MFAGVFQTPKLQSGEHPTPNRTSRNTVDEVKAAIA
jgi:hypothetical protein